MPKAGRDVRFAQEPGPVLGVTGEITREHLYGVLARQPRMLHQIDRAHRTRTEYPQDGVSREHLTDRKRHEQSVWQQLS